MLQATWGVISSLHRAFSKRGGGGATPNHGFRKGAFSRGKIDPPPKTRGIWNTPRDPPGSRETAYGLDSPPPKDPDRKGAIAPTA